MKLPVIKHEDDRRILTEYISDIPFKRAKVIEVKEDMVRLGKHYHNKSDSVFYMLKGACNYWLSSKEEDVSEQLRMYEGDCIFVPKGIVHTFELLKGSIMLETASEPYDKEDEIQVSQ